MKKYLLDFTIFISGAVVMIFEIVGSRILAPFLGTSLPVWTSLIGVMLGSLSVGYYAGGKLADKNSKLGVLILMLTAAALLISFTAIIKSFVLGATYFYISDIRLGSIVASVILFSPASVFLGMISPYAIKLRLTSLETSGKTIGSLYAISTIGSIVGTFAAGFFLIPMFGTIKILFLLSIILLFSVVILNPKELIEFKKINIFFVLSLFILYSISFTQSISAKTSFIDIETSYNSLRIYETKDKKTNRPVRCLATDPHGTQGAMFLDKDDDLVFDYLKYYRLGEHFNPNLKKGLFIGGGVYAFPKDFVKRNEQASLDVVEIDPGVTEVAKKFFNLQEHERINIIHEDGRTFLNQNKEKYDIVYLDAFNAHITIPFQLTTKEAVGKIYNALEENGLVLINIISSVEGDEGKFLRAAIATYKEYFDQVYVFSVNPDSKGFEYGNLMIAALKTKTVPVFNSEDKELNAYLNALWKKTISEDSPVLTDDYAPVDSYTSKFIKK